MDADYLPRLPFDLKEKQKEFFQCIHREPDRDIVVNLPVGFGKSILYYLLPFFLGVIKGVVNPLVVVISPLTLIHKDQLQKMENMNIKGYRMDQMGKMERTNGSIPTDSVKNKTVQMILQEFFKDEKTKINNEALELMTELITVFVEEAVSRTSRQAQKDGTTELSLEQFEKILPQLLLDI